MARHLPRRLLYTPPSPESIKKWRLATEKKKEHRPTAATLTMRNDRRIAMRHRKKQKAVHKQKRKLRRLPKFGKENQKQKLLKKRPNKCRLVVNTGCGCVGELVKPTTVVSSSSSRRDEAVTAAFQALFHDHCYYDTRPPSPALSSSPVLADEDSLQDLLDTCPLDVNFLKEAQHTHHVLLDDVINLCSVQPDGMFMDIDVEKDRAGSPLPSCLCCPAYSRSAPTRGIFTSAGSTETRLSTCPFSGSMFGAPLALPMVDMDWENYSMPCVSSGPFVSASSGVQDSGFQSGVTSSILDKLTSSSDGGKCEEELVRQLLETLVAKVDPDEVCKSSHCGFKFSASIEEAMRVGELVDKVSLQQTCSTPVRNKNCEENDSVASLHQGGSPFAHVDTDSDMTYSETLTTRTCTGMTQHGSSDRRSEGHSVTPGSPSSSCPFFDSPPPSPVHSEASTMASPCKKQRLARGLESFGKRLKSNSQDLTLTLPGSSAEMDLSDASGFQDISTPPSLSPSWDLPIFSSLPLSPLSDSGVMLSDDSSVTPRKKADDADDDRLTLTRPRGVPRSDDERVVPLTIRLSPGDHALKSGDGVTGSCLENYLKVFDKDVPLSPLNNFHRCV